MDRWIEELKEGKMKGRKEALKEIYQARSRTANLPKLKYPPLTEEAVATRDQNCTGEVYR